MGFISNDAEEFHGVGIIGWTPVVGSGGVHGDIFVCDEGLLSIGPWGGQLGPQHFALLLLHMWESSTGDLFCVCRNL